MRNTHRFTKRLFVLGLSGLCLVTNATCLSRQFADDLASDTARQLANLLIEALVINPLETAVIPDP
jgi:hypothetical protein